MEFVGGIGQQVVSAGDAVEVRSVHVAAEAGNDLDVPEAEKGREAESLGMNVVMLKVRRKNIGDTYQSCIQVNIYHVKII